MREKHINKILAVSLGFMLLVESPVVVLASIDGNGKPEADELIDEINMVGSDDNAYSGSYVLGSHSYEIYDEGITWEEAELKCEENGGHLITVASAEEQELLEDIISKGKRNFYWLGGEKVDGEWIWITGEDWTYSNWRPEEPNNQGGNESRLMIYKGYSSWGKVFKFGQWNDCPESGLDRIKTNESFGYICEWDNYEVDYLNRQSFHQVTLNFNSDFDKGIIPVEIDWGNELFSSDAKEYNYNLALVGVVMAKSVYEEEEEPINENFKRLGFDEEHICHFGNDSENLLENLSHPLTYVAYKKIYVNGEGKNLFFVAIRGTASEADFLSDIFDGAHSFGLAAKNTKMDLETAMVNLADKSLSKLKEEDNIFYICGHSYGAATANRLATGMEDYATADNIFAYTYETPHTCWESYNAPDTEVVPHNFINVKDPVPYLPMYPSATTYGIEYFFNSDHLSNQIFSDKIHKGGNVVLSARAMLYGQGEYIFADFFTKAFTYHHMDWDLLAIYQQQELGNAFSKSWCLKKTGELLDGLTSQTPMNLGVQLVSIIACPVDVEIYSDDILLAKSVGDKAENYDIDKACLYIFGDKKVIISNPNESYEIHYTGTATGSMNCIIGSFDYEDNKTQIIKQFNNIQLEEDKKFVSKLITDDEGKATNDIDIFVVDSDGTIIGEVSEGGEENIINSIILSSSGNGGNIIPNGKTIVPLYNQQGYSIVPEENYQIKDVLIDDISIGATDNYSFENVFGNHTIVAIFEKINKADENSEPDAGDAERRDETAKEDKNSEEAVSTENGLNPMEIKYKEKADVRGIIFPYYTKSHPDDVIKKIKFKSSNKKIVKVNNKGRAKGGKQSGTATISMYIRTEETVIKPNGKKKNRLGKWTYAGVLTVNNNGK